MASVEMIYDLFKYSKAVSKINLSFMSLAKKNPLSGGLPPEVLRQLRTLGLVAGLIKKN